MLLDQLQQVKAVPAHHSHPTDSYDVKFMRGGHRYQFRIGRDSYRTNEYWVFETARAENPGREIGRIESSTLGELLSSLARGQAAPKH